MLMEVDGIHLLEPMGKAGREGVDSAKEGRRGKALQFVGLHQDGLFGATGF